jgi:hypothetical protein
MSEVETEFLLISEAVARLEAGMFGGAIKRPEPVEAFKAIDPRFSGGWGLHKEKAAAAIHAATIAGDLTVLVFTLSIAGRVSRPLQVPIDVLNRLLRVRGGLPDHAIRPPVNLLRVTSIDSEVFVALSSSAMFLQASEFQAWYERQKGRRRWPSQRESKKPPTGRPSKQDDQLLTSIRARVAEEKWSASDGIAKLVRLLATHGAPNRNLVRRAVQRLHVETGILAYRVVPRKRAKRKPAGSLT